MLLARSNVEQLIVTHSLYPDVVASDGMSEAVNAFLASADARVGDDTFTLKFRYHDPALVEKVTAAMAQSLIDQSAKYRVEQARSTSDFLATQQQTAKRELMNREEALAEFLAAHPEFAHDMLASGGGAGSAGASIRAHDRKDAANEAAALPHVEALQRQRLRLAQRISAIDNPEAVPPPQAPSSAALDPQISRALDQARSQLERVSAELADVQARFTDKHPDVARARGKVAAAGAALAAAEAAASQARSDAPPSPLGVSAPPGTEADRKELQSRLSQVEADLKKAGSRGGAATANGEAASGWVVDLETRWASLHRELRDVQDRYEQIERRAFHASIIDSVEAAGGAAQMTIVDPAYRPQRPAARGARRVGAAAASLVLMLLAALALLLTSIDDRLYDREDLDKLAIDGFMHVVPHDKRG
jgi:uncharacterized protein involved in exopolysaccharide biosynthesis